MMDLDVSFVSRCFTLSASLHCNSVFSFDNPRIDVSFLGPSESFFSYTLSRWIWHRGDEKYESSRMGGKDKCAVFLATSA